MLLLKPDTVVVFEPERFKLTAMSLLTGLELCVELQQKDDNFIKKVKVILRLQTH
jgi:hypothetical protein